MADSRRWFTLLVVIALFTGVAAAQNQTVAPFQCNAVTQNTPTLRSEGITELVGEIVISCTGGSIVPASSNPLPQTNIIVSLTAPVTSRLQSASAAGSPSEALLLIDEPTAPLTPIVAGFGPQAPLQLCTSTTGGCLEYPSNATAIGGAPVVVATNTVGGTTPGFNVFQGLASGQNQVIFPGVPVLPPATTTISRVYRIVNIRVNATSAGASLISGIQPVYAYLSTSGPSSLPVGTQALTVGFVQTSLTVKAVPTLTNFTQCNPATDQKVALLQYTENFPSAFKTRVQPLVNTSTGSSYLQTNSGTPGQNVPGNVYNTESGFILPLSGTFTAGLADSGTRFKAVFANLPAGITLKVTNTNVDGAYNAPTFTAGVPVAGVGGSSTSSYALLTTGGEAGAFANTNGTTLSLVSIGTTTSTVNTLTAVWEVVNANQSAQETFNFGVYLSYAPAGVSPNNTPSLTPATNGPSVTQSYAPISTVSAASTSAWIPRFVLGSNATTQPILSIVPCQTILLFPYVTTMSGLDTGIAISNTSLDPLTPLTATSQGSCRLYFYGSTLASTAITPPATPPSIGPIAPGNPDWTKAAFLASSQFGNNVTGYMFAVCDFQYAHGFAFISDVGLRNLAMGYLALVVTDPTATPLKRPGTDSQHSESLEN